jgi:CRP/FNR family transcriptional regulator, cyclic AMP receptor protein
MIDVQASRTGAGLRFAELLGDESLGARILNVKGGEYIFDFDTPADRVFLIHAGQVRIFQDLGPQGPRLLDILGASQICGIIALGNADRYRSRAVATGAAKLSYMSGDRVRDLLTQYPRASLDLIALLVTRMTNAIEMQGRLITESCEERLVQTLLRFSSSAAALPAGDDVVLRMTHAQLAEAVGAARETVSVCLTNLRHRKLLRTGRNQLVFNPALLRKLQQN